MKRRISRLVLGLLASLACALVSVTAATAQEQPRRGGTLTVITPSDVSTFDPHPAVGFSVRVFANIYEPLFRKDEKGVLHRAPRPVVALPRPHEAPGHAPEGREVPQRERADRRGREVHVRAAAEPRRPGAGRGGHQDDQDADPGRGPVHAGPRDAGAERRAGGHARPVAGDPDPGLRRDQEVGQGLRSPPVGDRALQVRRVGARPAREARAQRRLLEWTALPRLPGVQGGARGGDPGAGARERRGGRALRDAPERDRDAEARTPRSG